MRRQPRSLVGRVCAFVVAAAAVASASSAPEITNVTAQQRYGSALVDIYYDVYDADGDLMVVTAKCSDGAGGWVTVSSTQQGSDIGPEIASGQGKHIVWDAGIDMPGHVGDEYVVRLTACDPGDVPGMVFVPAGTFIMGDGVTYCGVDEREVTLTRDFYLGQHEVTNQEYMEAVQWAYDHGYVTATTASVRDNMDGSTQELLDLDGGYSEIAFSGGVFFVCDTGHGGSNGNHPVKEVTWYGAARYCDWLSLQAGLPRAYQHTGDWSCNGGDPYGAAGYRMPTDAEWEYAAQYDDERIYPWGDENPGCDRANYSVCVGWTSPVGSYPDAPMALGLSDMAGNVWEWCNDWWVCNLGTTSVHDPVGPGSGTYRVTRGSSWYTYGYPRCAVRLHFNPAYNGTGNYGFRVARTESP